jgi:tetratricopeptide (TPR) repeat protein
MAGNYDEARRAAGLLAAHVGPLVKNIPPLEGFMTIPLSVEIRFQKWDQILATPKPDPAMKTTNVFWHFARGMALASKGKLVDAEAEYNAVAEAEAATPPDVIFNMPVNNKAKDILKIAKNVLGAKIAMAKHDNAAALLLLREAVTIQDSLKYGEPPDWFFPVRETLGAALLMEGKAAEAEKIFRDDLDRNPRNPRSLLGLREALKAQHREYDAQFVDRQFKAAWKSLAKLTVQDLT